MLQPQLGDFVKYNGFKNAPDGHTLPTVCIAQVIGYDEERILTDIVYPHDHNTRYTGWEEAGTWNEWDELNTSKPFRIGFHRSRLIEIMAPGTISKQSKLFS